MDPLRFLDVAKALADSKKEEEARTSIGRSYYATFNHLRGQIALHKALPSGPEVHSVVVRYLSTANNRELQSVAQTLKDLRGSRNTADYDMVATLDEKQSQLALSKAGKAIQKFQGVNQSTFKALIDAQPTYSS